MSHQTSVELPLTASPPAKAWTRQTISWSLYDFANTIYSMNIVSLYAKRYIVEDLGHSDAVFDVPFSISMLLTALIAPALGVMSDYQTKKKMFLLLFTLTCCIAVAGMAVAATIGVFALILLFIIANFSYEAGQPFYNSLLYSVADGKTARYVSGVGVSLGYIGSIFGMILVAPFVSGEIFGLTIPGVSGSGKVGAFVPTAILFFLFSIPLFLVVKERRVVPRPRPSLRGAYQDVWDGLRKSRQYPSVTRFLFANFLFQDTINTIIVNIGLYLALVIGFDEPQIRTFLITSTLTAVIGAYIIGRLSRALSLKVLMNVIVMGWIICLVSFVFVTRESILWILGSAIGVFLGGMWAVSRPMLAELTPREELGRFFGLFSMVGRAAAVFGPLVWTLTVAFLSAGTRAHHVIALSLGLDETAASKLPYQAAVLVLALMMVLGLFIFRKVLDPDRNASHGR